MRASHPDCNPALPVAKSMLDSVASEGSTCACAIVWLRCGHLPNFLVGVVKKSLHELNTDAEQVENRVQPVIGLNFSFNCQSVLGPRCFDAEFLERGSLG